MADTGTLRVYIVWISGDCVIDENVSKRESQFWFDALIEHEKDWECAVEWW